MKASSSLVILLTILLAGCGGDDLGRKVTGPAKHAPKYPAKTNVPVDETLKSDAKREISIAFSGTDPVLKAHAIEAIQEVLPNDNTNDVWGAMKDSNTLVRFAAVLAVGEMKNADAKPELQQLVDDPQPIVRVAAIFSLHRLGDYTYSKDLQRYAQDMDPEVRGNTALVLGLLGEQSAINVLKPMKNDESVPVRLQAAESLWRLGNEDGRDYLIGATVSGNPGYQMVAMMGLGAPKNKIVRAHIRANLTADYPEVCLVAARVMGELDSDEGYGVAMEGAKSADPRQRALAALAFGGIGRLDAQPYLAKLIKDNNAEVRIAAATGELQLVKQAGQ